MLHTILLPKMENTNAYILSIADGLHLFPIFR